MRTVVCANCGTVFDSDAPRRKWCDGCKAVGARTLKPYTARWSNCSSCGQRVHRSRTSADTQMCLACRRERRRTVCVDCGSRISGRSERCPECSLRARLAERYGPGYVPNKDSARNARLRSAPGLKGRARRELMERWRRQGRRCFYCDTGAPEHIDHVVPLAFGGTNYEGNLVPACAACNMSKGARFVVEWRAGVKLNRTPERPDILPPAPRKKREPRPRPEPRVVICAICGEPFKSMQSNALMCSDACRAERFARQMRDRYRMRLGLPGDLNEPTKPWLKGVRHGQVVAA